MSTEMIVDAGFRIYPQVLDEEECSQLLESLAEVPRTRAGCRHLFSQPSISALAHDSRLTGIATAFLGTTPFPYRATLFDKSPGSNWLVVWHQDTALPFKSRFAADGWGPWSVKAGVLYAHSPASALSRIMTFRIHLDASGPLNGPLRIVPGSHRFGVLSDEAIATRVQASPVLECLVPRGGILAIRPLILHSSGKATDSSPRRVIHIEYADSPALGIGRDLAVA